MSEQQPVNRLKANSVTTLGALAISAAFMGPAVSVFFNTGPAAGTSGPVFPLSFAISMIAILFVANSVIEFSRKVPGAGFAFTFASQGVGPRMGFISGWLLLLGYAMISPITYAGFGLFGSQFLERQFGWHVSWIILFLAVALLVSLLSYLGVSRSAVVTIIFLVLELALLISLCLTIVFGSHNSLAPFTPANAPNGISSIGLGMVFGILSFVGFEGAANLGEETTAARKAIPRAIFLAVIGIGIVYVLGAYAAETGFGSATRLAADSAPFDTLARHFWGNGFAWLIDLTALNSVFANAVAGQTSAVRNIYALGREGILPRIFGRTNQRGVPINAIIADFVLAMVLGLSIGLWQGPWMVWTLLGGIMALCLILVYGCITAALMFFYRRKFPAEYSIVRHAILPAVSLLLLLLPLYGSVWPIPAFPYNLGPYVIICWLVIGTVYLFSIMRTDPLKVQRFGSIFEESEGTEKAVLPEEQSFSQQSASAD
jgi:amino acid transporter